VKRMCKVAVIVSSYKDAHRKIAAGVGQYSQQVGNWSVYVEAEPAARIPDLRQWRSDGIIADLGDREIARAVLNSGIPVVGIGGFASPELLERTLGKQVPYVATDNIAIGRMGADHLLECGFEHLAYCGIPWVATNSWVEWRRRGFVARLAEAGLRSHSFLGRHRTAKRWPQLQAELKLWLSTLPRPVGIMACNDARAHHVLEACREAGLRVPEDVAVLGVDNDLMMCEMSIPSLSSIEQDVLGIGYRAGAALDRLMHGKRVPPWTRVDPKIIVTRQSTTIVAVKDPLVATALRFIHSHTGDLIQVEQVTGALGVSRTTLDSRFRQILGRTTHDEIERTRLRMAKTLLATTDLPLRIIATRSGFRNDNYMGYVFRRALGVSPGVYRKQLRLTDGTGQLSGSRRRGGARL